MPVLRAATRGSPLARWQTDHVAALLAAAGVEVEPVVVTTRGDLITDVPLHQVGGQGVFVKEVQEAVLAGAADFAVHSAKDLPSLPTDGLVIAAVPVREDPRDALVGSTLAGLPSGARVGTGSVRRRAQLAAVRPDLTFAELRGNIGTRLEKSAQFNAIVMAAAALRRLGEDQRIAEVLEPSVVLPQVGQGALAVECRAGDDAVRALLATIEDATSRACVDAERAFLARIGGGCDLPVGALATMDGADVYVDGLMASLDGHVVVRGSLSGLDPVAVGAAVADQLLAAGGAALVAELTG